MKKKMKIIINERRKDMKWKYERIMKIMALKENNEKK